MRLPGVLAALAVLALIPSASAAADPLGTATSLVHVGPGATESSQRQVVRTREGVVYIVSVEDDGWGVGEFADLHVYRATTAGIPSAFAVRDAADEPRVAAPLRMSGGDARIDAAGTIHVTYAVVDGDTISVRYQTFDTVGDTWGQAERVATMPADDDGIRGRVASALALDPSGAPVVVTASSSGVSAWTRTSAGEWSRRALSGEHGLHPSLAFDASGRAHLAWLASPYGDASIRYATRAPDGTWSEPSVVADEQVLTNKALDQSPSVAFDGGARPTVAYLDGDYHVRVAVREGETWVEDGPSGVFSHSPGLYVRGRRADRLPRPRRRHPSRLPPPAEEPPPADPVTLLGDPGLRPQTDYTPSGMAEAFQSVAETSGTLGSISVYLDAGSTADRLVAGLYSDVDGHPGTLLAQGSAAAAADGWNAVAIPGTAVREGGRYWVALLGTGAGRLTFRDEPAGECRSETTPWELELAELPTTWTAGNVWDDCPVSAYGVGA